MHGEVTEWLRNSTEVPWEGAHVVEVGSADWNGRASDYVSGWASWIGVDIAPAANVDIVGDAIEVLPTLDPCDIVVTTEVFEHTAQWCDIVAAIAGVLRLGGWMVATCAGTGRPVHSADGAPTLKPDEHYANVSLHELRACAEAYGIEMVRGEEGPPGDTRYIGRRTSAF
jgi:hypothetical protein